MNIKNKRLNTLLLITCVVILTMSCINTQQIVPTLVPTINPASLKSQINVHDGSSWVWNEIPSPAFDPYPKHSPQLVIGLDGRLHLFWDTLAGSNDDFIYHSYLQDGVWSNPLPISMSLGSSEILEKPIVGVDGTIHVIWYNTLKLGGPYRLLYSQFDGVKWGTESEIYISEKDPNLSGMLFSDANGVVHAIVDAPDHMDSSIFYLTQIAGNWDIPKPMMSPMGFEIVIWKYFPDSQGGVKFYGRSLDGKLRYTYWHNGSLDDVIKTDITLPLYDDNVFSDTRGNYYIYWTGSVSIPGGATTGAYYQCTNSDLIAWPELVLSGETNVITRPLLAQSQSSLVLSWLAKENKITFLFPGGCETADLYTFDLPEIKQSRQPLDIVMSDNPKELCYLNKVQMDKYEIFCTDLK